MKKYVLFVLVILIPRTASSHMRITLASGLNPAWASMPVAYWINENGSPDIPNGSDFAAVQASFQTWQSIPSANIQFTYKGTTPVATVGLDGMNVVTFTDNTTPLGSSTIAATFSFFNAEDGHVLFQEADIAFNTAMTFSTSAEANKFDVQSVLTHEIGHFLGLDHSALVSSVMVPFGVPSQLDQRTLAYDDIAGVMEIYPTAFPIQRTGQISGRIQSGTSNVFGAHVIAINSSGTAVASTLSQQDGGYAIRVLPPDTYRVVVEPLDGPVLLQHIGGTNGFYSTSNNHFGTTYFGKVTTLPEATPIVLAAGDSITADIQVFPASATGLNLTRPTFGIRMARGRTATLVSSIGGLDISSGVIFTASNSGIQFGPFTFGGRVSSTAPTSVSVEVTTAPSVALGPKILAVNRGTDASVIGGAFVITDPSPGDISVTSATGPVEGGTQVAVRGSGIRPGAQVYFAGLPGTGVQLLDPSTLLVTAPANTPGDANIVIVNTDGTWGVGQKLFTYVALPPTISDVSPLIGPPATEVTIRGNHFDSRQQNMDVRFNGSPARVIRATANIITAIVPFGATSGPITVTVFGQIAAGPAFTVTTSATSANVAAQRFKFIDANAANGGTTLDFSTNDDGIARVDLPFNFALFRDIYLAGARISVGINGYLSLETLSFDEFQNASLPAKVVTRGGSTAGTSGSVPPSLIAPFWDDLILHFDSAITTKTLGVAPNRQFVVEWSNLSILDEMGEDLNASISFEAVLYEGSNDLQFLYSSMNGPRSDGSSATVGIQNLKQDTAVQTGFNQTFISNGYFTTYRFQNGTYSDSLPAVTEPAEVMIIPAAPQDGTRFTGLAFVASSAMSVALSAFDTNGNLITGSGIQNPVTITLTAGQEYAKLVSELFGLESFDGWIEADASATGLGIFVATGSSDMLHLDGSTVVDLADDFVLFHPGASAILVNPSSRIANVTLTALSTGTSQSLAIAPRSRLVTTLGDVTRVHSSEPLSSMERVAAARSLASTAAIPVSQAQPTLVFPDALVGAGYSSVLTIANTGAAQQTVTIVLGAFSTSVTINPNAAISGSIANLLRVPQNALITGAVRISASSASLIGVLDVQTQTDSAIVPAQPGATSYTLLNVINGNGFYTGLAFATGNAGALVRIDLYSPAGNLVASGTTSLAANEQLSKLLNELIPAAASQLGGYVRIHSDQPIWAWELFGSPTALASAPPL